MNQQQIAILNSLITYAAEYVPGGLSEDEREVAKIAGIWALKKKEFRIKYAPMLVGFTKDGEKIVVYMDVDHKQDLYIRRPDGILSVMGPGATIEMHSEPGENHYQMKINSPGWIGEAVGSRKDFTGEEPLRLL